MTSVSIEAIDVFWRAIEFFQNSGLIRQIQQNKIYKNSEIWPGIELGSLA